MADNQTTTDEVEIEVLYTTGAHTKGAEYDDEDDSDDDPELVTDGGVDTHSPAAKAGNTDEFDRPALGSEPISRLLDAVEVVDTLRLEVVDNDTNVVLDADVIGDAPEPYADDAVEYGFELDTDDTVTAICYDPKHTTAVGTSDVEPWAVTGHDDLPVVRAEIVEHATPVTTTNVKRQGYRRTDGLRSGTRIFRTSLKSDESRRRDRQARFVGSLYEGQAVLDRERDAVLDVLSFFTGAQGVRYVALRARDAPTDADPEKTVAEIPVHQFAYAYIVEGRYSFLKPREDGSPVVSSFPAHSDRPSDVCTNCGSASFERDEQQSIGGGDGVTVKRCRYCERYGAAVHDGEYGTMFTTGVLDSNVARHVDELDRVELRSLLKKKSNVPASAR